MVQCQQYVFYILFSFTVYMWGPFSPLRNTPPGVSGRTPVSNRGRGHLAAICDLGAARAGCVRGACSGQRGARVACLAVARERFFCGTKKWFNYFSLHASLYAIYGHVCVHGSLNFGGPVPPPGRFGIWAPSWLKDGTFASLACAYCLALEVCALTCSFTRSHFDWNQR